MLAKILDISYSVPFFIDNPKYTSKLYNELLVVVEDSISLIFSIIMNVF